MFKRGACHIFPALVKAFDAMGKESFRDIAESHVTDVPISTKWMLNDKI